MSARPDVVRGPRVKWIPRAKNDFDGQDAIALATSYGLIPDAWQALIVLAWMLRRPDGKFAAGRCGLAVPRQNGKNAVIEIRELFGMVVLGEKFLHTAHEVKTARKAFKRLLHFFDPETNRNAPAELVAMVVEIRRTNGQEAIVLTNGGSIEFVARSKGSGRGFTVDVLVLDEAQALSDDELEAIRPVVSSAPLGDPQIIYTGTPPNRDKGEAGEAFLRVRRLAGKDKRLCWIEYGAPDGPMPDIDDLELLQACNPSLGLRHGNGAYGLTMNTVRDERGDLSPAGYARERYGWWGDPETKHRGVIDMQTWASLKSKVTLPPPQRATVVLDVSPDLEWTSIGAASAGLTADETLILLYHQPGTAWAPDQVRSLQGTLQLVEVALTPTAKMFSADLTKAGVEHKVLSAAEARVGCGWFQERIKAAGIVHIGQADLDSSVKNARTRYVAGVQDWDARDPRVDMSPLRATSIAAQRWALLTAKPKPAPPAPVRASASTSPVRPGQFNVGQVGF